MKRFFVKYTNNILYLLVVIAIYLSIRVIFGNQLLSMIEGNVSPLLVKYSYNGVNLRELSNKKLGTIQDTKSNISLTQSNNILDGNVGIKTTNPKTLAMRKFLLDYSSPMYPYSNVLVEEAEKYGLDWRLVASISGVESAFGNLIPPGSNNGWGWRGGPGGAYSIFSNWGEGIKTVTSRLALGYGTDLTPFDIEPVYCPPCYANPAHAWANGVTRFMNELSYYLENLEKI